MGKGAFITAAVVGFIFVYAATDKDKKPTAQPVQATQKQFLCSQRPYSIPQVKTYATLKACQDAARQMMGAMLANLKVTVACREDFLNAYPALSSSAAAQQVRDSNDGIRRLMASVERGASEQIRNANTLLKCHDYLTNAQKLINMQPEFAGKWD